MESTSDSIHLGSEPTKNNHRGIQKETNSAYEQDLVAANPPTIEAVTDTEATEADESSDFSEDSLNEGMRSQATPITIKDAKGEVHAIMCIVDTGSVSSFISSETVAFYGLKERPLLKCDWKEFSSAIADKKCTPETFVILWVKCKKFGIDNFVKVSLRVLPGAAGGIDAIFGLPIIQRHNILINVLKNSNPGYPLFVLKEARSKDQEAKDDAAKQAQRERALDLEKGKSATPLPEGSKVEGNTASQTTVAGPFIKEPPSKSSTGSASSNSTAS